MFLTQNTLNNQLYNVACLNFNLGCLCDINGPSEEQKATVWEFDVFYNGKLSNHLKH